MDCIGESHADRRWKKLASSYLFQRWWMNVRVDRVRLPSGVELEEFHVIEYPDWAAVLCLTEEQRVVMVEQYRYGIDRVTLELPAGAIDTGETPEEAARRELLEETGYEAEAWIYLGACAPEPSKHTNYAHLFVAHGGRKLREARPERSEDIRVCLLEPAEVVQAARRGEVVHGIHLAAIFWSICEGLLPQASCA